MTARNQGFRLDTTQEYGGTMQQKAFVHESYVAEENRTEPGLLPAIVVGYQRKAGQHVNSIG
jgi:hypothetical protein